MNIEWIDQFPHEGQAGLFQGLIAFSNPGLADYRWPVYEIRGIEPGSRLCVMAGVHVNEVSAMEAAVRLAQLFKPEMMKGSVSIIPLVNQPAYGQFTEYNCPLDNKNINFTFPGDPEGTFSDRLCDALQNKWALEADCTIDLHGGDLREQVAKFVMFQRGGDGATEAAGLRLARCFDAEIVMGLPPELMQSTGRAPTGFARQGRMAIMSEAGGGGVRDEVSIRYHVDGVLNVAAALGILDTVPRFRRARQLCHDYLWVDCPATGQFYPDIEPGDHVTKGQILGVIRDFFGRQLGSIIAPADGIVLWRLTHATVVGGVPILAVAVPSR